MTLSATTQRNDYTGDGAHDTYAYTFRIDSDSDLEVKTRTSAGVVSTLVLTTNYTVTGAGESTGGNVTLVAGNLTSGSLISIRRVKALTQTTDIRNQGDFYPETHEDQFDKFTMTDQQLQDGVNRSVRLTESYSPSTYTTTLPVPAAGQSIRWNSGATALEAYTPNAGDSITHPTTNGMVAYTGSSTYISRTIAATDSSITVTNGDGQSGAPTIKVATSGVTNTHVDKTAITGQSLKATPIAADSVLLYDSAGAALAKATLSSVVSLASANHYRRTIGWQMQQHNNATVTVIAGANIISAQGTASAVSDANGSYIQYASAASTNSDAGWVMSGNSMFQLRHEPIAWWVGKTGSGAQDIVTCRILNIMSDLNGGTDMQSDTPPNGYVGFRYFPATDLTAFWRCVSDNRSGSPTVTVTSVAIAADTRYEFKVDCSDPTSILYYINGTLVATHTTTLPLSTAGLALTSCLRTLDNTARDWCISNFHAEYN